VRHLIADGHCSVSATSTTDNRRAIAACCNATIEVAGFEAEAHFRVQARGPATALPGVACEYGIGSQRMTVCPWEHPPATCGDFVPSVLRSNY
jgi:hypothetical protein